MRIPFWQRDQAHPTKAIDRLQNHRGIRQVIGISVDEDFSCVSASLVQVKGFGKFARFRELKTAGVPLEDSAREVLRDLTLDSNPTETDIQFAGSELAAYQANCCRSLLAKTKVHARDIVALGVTDPGIVVTDFEGRSIYKSLTNAMELASRTSITVIDQFSERDQIDGGSGQNLFALGYWFLFGDRSPRVAEENRLLFLRARNRVEAFFLPASDGLDSVLPQIELESTPLKTSESFGEDALEDWLFARVSGCCKRSSPLALRVISDMQIPFALTEIDESIKYSTLEEFSIHLVAATSSAFLANAFVDQLPVSIPEITGNTNPRVLGTLTPGSLVNFRNFVLEASKVSPAIMRLRDAV